jgi:hypothetical protein
MMLMWADRRGEVVFAMQVENTKQAHLPFSRHSWHKPQRQVAFGPVGFALCCFVGVSCCHGEASPMVAMPMQHPCIGWEGEGLMGKWTAGQVSYDNDVDCTSKLANVDCTVTKIDCTMMNVDCTLPNVDCGLRNIDCALWNVDCTLTNVNCTLLYSLMSIQ